MEVGTAGIRLAQELLTPYDRLIIVDAMARGGAPGTVYVSEVAGVEAIAEVDLHLAVPSRALAVAQALGALPREVFLIGCEPAEVDELTTELTPPVEGAVDKALAHVRRLAGAGRGTDALEALKQGDEILQIMFWLRGEGLGLDVAVADILRFVDDAPAVRAALARLAEDGLIEAFGDGVAVRYRLTADGVREGRRRFLDEFEPYLARHAHGECGAADCDCHDGGTECRGAV
jgi:hydrogenase maturation protease